MHSTKSSASGCASGSWALTVVSRGFDAEGQVAPMSPAHNSEDSHASLCSEEKNWDGALKMSQLSSCRGLLLYYATCVYLFRLRLRLRFDRAWKCTSVGNGMKRQREWKSGRGRWGRSIIGIGGENGTSNGAIT